MTHPVVLSLAEWLTYAVLFVGAFVLWHRMVGALSRWRWLHSDQGDALEALGDLFKASTHD